MKKRRLKIIGSAVLISLVLLLILGFFFRQKVKDIEPPTEETEAMAELEEEPETMAELEEKEPETMASQPGPVLGSPALQGDHADAIRQHIEDTGAVVSRVDDGIHTLIYPYEGRHSGVPLVEFRFRKINHEGELEKACVTLLWMKRRVGSVTKRIRPPSGDIHFEEFVGLGGADNLCVYGFRIGAGPQGVGNRLVAFGKRYHMIFRVIDPDRESIGEYEEYESIVRIPEDIPEGKMAVVYVIAELPRGTIPKGREEEVKKRKI